MFGLTVVNVFSFIVALIIWMYLLKWLNNYVIFRFIGGKEINNYESVLVLGGIIALIYLANFIMK